MALKKKREYGLEVLVFCAEMLMMKEVCAQFYTPSVHAIWFTYTFAFDYRALCRSLVFEESLPVCSWFFFIKLYSCDPWCSNIKSEQEITLEWKKLSWHAFTVTRDPKMTHLRFEGQHHVGKEKVICVILTAITKLSSMLETSREHGLSPFQCARRLMGTDLLTHWHWLFKTWGLRSKCWDEI